MAIERMKTSGSVAWSCIRTRSPSSAPPEKGEDGSTASTADPLAEPPVGADQSGGGGRLADAGRAGEADHVGVAGERGQRGHHLAQLRRGALDQRDQPGHGPWPARPRLFDQRGHVGHRRLSPWGVVWMVRWSGGVGGPARPTHPTFTGRQPEGLLRPKERSGRRTAQTEGTWTISASPWPPPPHSAAAPMPPPRRLSSSARVQHDPGAGHPDRVTERDRATVDVDLLQRRRRAP